MLHFILLTLMGITLALKGTAEPINTPIVVKDQLVFGINQPGIVLNAPITVLPSATLIFQNTTVFNWAEQPPILQAPSSTIILDNTLIVLTDQVHIPWGNIIIKGSCRIAGPHVWQHSAPTLCEITSKSSLTFAAQATFQYNGSEQEKEAFLFSERSSTLHLDNAHLRAGPQGLLMRTGSFLIEGRCTVYAENNNPTKGITLGTGRRVRDNMRFKFASGDSTLKVIAPHFQEKHKRSFLLKGLAIAGGALLLCGGLIATRL